MSDLGVSIALATFSLAVVLTYLVRVALSGRARHARCEADGGSLFLGKSVMEMGYWIFSPVASWLARLGITADGITSFALVPGLGAGIAAATGHLGAACALGATAALCDLLDGLVARETGGPSKAGELLDATVDRYVESFLLGGLAIHFRDNGVVLSLALLALLGSFMVSYGSARIPLLGLSAPRGFMRRAERAVFVLVPCGLTPFFSNWLMAGHREMWLREWPVVAGLAIVAAGANLSAAQRLRASRLRLTGQSAAQSDPRSAPRQSMPVEEPRDHAEGADLSHGQAPARTR